MVLDCIYYTDKYTKNIAKYITDKYDVVNNFFRICNPTFHRWSMGFNRYIHKKKNQKNFIPNNSLLIGGNRWRHHFAVNLSHLPIISIDAHTDMSYDEMIPLKLIRPYNWLYFKLLDRVETHLVLPYDSFKWKRWDIVLPIEYSNKFHLYSFHKRRSKVPVSISIMNSKMIKVNDVMKKPPIPCINKQISLDLDITREIDDEEVMNLLGKIYYPGDIVDIWLDEGKRDKRQTLQDHKRSCISIYQTVQ